MFMDQVKDLPPNNPHYNFLVKGNPFLHMLLSSDMFGVCRESQTKIGEACGMSRQEVRTYLDKMKEMGLITSTKESKKINGNWVSVTTITFSPENSIFIDLDEKNKIPRFARFGYPQDFEDDWVLYRGRDRMRIGNKSDAYYPWAESVEKYGREALTRGTRNYIADCESNDIWKKQAKTFWNTETAYFLDERYQVEGRTPEEALVDLIYYKGLKRLIEGGACFTAKNDPYMIEALLIVKGTHPTIGTVIDKKGDNKFRESFLSAYRIAMKRSKKELRDKIYSNKEPIVEWDVKAESK